MISRDLYGSIVMNFLGGFPIRFVQWMMNDRTDDHKVVVVLTKGNKRILKIGKTGKGEEGRYQIVAKLLP